MKIMLCVVAAEVAVLGVLVIWLVVVRRQVTWTMLGILLLGLLVRPVRTIQILYRSKP